MANPVFDRSGKYLFFFGSTDAGPAVDWFAQSSADMRASRNVYLAVLRNDLPSPLARERDEEKPAAAPGAPATPATPGADPMRIDIDDITFRILDMPIAAGQLADLLTGAAGLLGQYLRPELHKRWPIRSSDMRPIDTPMPGEETATCDLTDRDAVFKAVEGCDAVLHFGGISIEGTFDQILSVNINGTYNVFEGARRAGTKRVIFASSNHAIGYYPRESYVDSDAQPRPDTYYGVSKSFGESLGAMDWSKYGIEHASLRIGSCREEPVDRRGLSTWLSFRDLHQMIVRCLEAQRLGYAEADPTFDIEGVDAAHKVTILSAIAFGIPVQFDEAHVEGITKLQAVDITYAEQLGYRIKLLGIARRRDAGIELRVHPTLVPAQRLIANVEGAMNAVMVQGDAVGTTLYLSLIHI